MKSIFYLVLTILIFAAVAFNSDQEDQASKHDNTITNEPHSVQVSKRMSSESGLTKGITKVLTSLNELKLATKPSNGKKDEINNAAEDLGETWDQIEKQVEKKYPEDYERIEKSLYPLLAEAKRDNPNIELVNQLLETTTTKVQVFKEMIGTTSS